MKRRAYAAPWVSLVLMACFVAIHLSAAGQTPLRFDVASVKAADRSAEVQWEVTPVRFRGLTSLLDYVAFALDVDHRAIRGPEWITRELFDIQATMAAATAPAELKAMLQTLLRERFLLQARRENQPLAVLALVKARDDGRPGPNLRPVSRDCANPTPAQPRCVARFVGPGAFVAVGANWGTSFKIETILSTMVQDYVIDKTGILGQYDLELTWAPEALVGDPRVAGRPSLYTALQEQLGLKLERRTEQLPVVFVDRVERPTPN